MKDDKGDNQRLSTEHPEETKTLLKMLLETVLRSGVSNEYGFLDFKVLIQFTKEPTSLELDESLGKKATEVLAGAYISKHEEAIETLLKVPRSCSGVVFYNLDYKDREALKQFALHPTSSALDESIGKKAIEILIEAYICSEIWYLEIIQILVQIAEQTNNHSVRLVALDHLHSITVCPEKVQFVTDLENAKEAIFKLCLSIMRHELDNADDTRLSAIRLLVNFIADERFFLLLCAELEYPNKVFRLKFAIFLDQTEEWIESLAFSRRIKLLLWLASLDADSDVQTCAAKGLCKLVNIYDDTGSWVLRYIVQSDNPNVRKTTAEVLADILDKLNSSSRGGCYGYATEVLLNAKKPDYCKTAVNSLAKTIQALQSYTDAVLALQQIVLQDTEPGIQAAVLKVSSQRMSDFTALPLLQAVLKDLEPDLRIAVVKILSSIEPGAKDFDQAVKILVQIAVQDTEPNVQKAAVEILSNENSPLKICSVPVSYPTFLLSLLRDSDTNVRIDAIDNVSKSSATLETFPRVQETLRNMALLDTEPNVRIAAIESFSRLVKNPWARDVLIQALHDRVPAVQIAAIQASSKISSDMPEYPNLIKTLVQVLRQNPEPKVCVKAIKVLQQLESETADYSEIVETLRELALKEGEFEEVAAEMEEEEFEEIVAEIEAATRQAKIKLQVVAIKALVSMESAWPTCLEMAETLQKMTLQEDLVSDVKTAACNALVSINQKLVVQLQATAVGLQTSLFKALDTLQRQLIGTLDKVLTCSENCSTVLDFIRQSISLNIESVEAQYLCEEMLEETNTLITIIEKCFSALQSRKIFIQMPLILVLRQKYQEFKQLNQEIKEILSNVYPELLIQALFTQNEASQQETTLQQSIATTLTIGSAPALNNSDPQQESRTSFLPSTQNEKVADEEEELEEENFTNHIMLLIENEEDAQDEEVRGEETEATVLTLGIPDTATQALLTQNEAPQQETVLQHPIAITPVTHPINNGVLSTQSEILSVEPILVLSSISATLTIRSASAPNNSNPRQESRTSSFFSFFRNREGQATPNASRNQGASEGRVSTPSTSGASEGLAVTQSVRRRP